MHIAPFDNENRPIVDVDDALVPLNYFNIVKLTKGQLDIVIKSKIASSLLVSNIRP